jgi:hypothetical protein
MPKVRGNGDGSYRILPTGTHEGRQMVNGQRLTAYGRTRGEAQARLRAKVTKARAGVVVRDGNAKLSAVPRRLDRHQPRQYAEGPRLLRGDGSQSPHPQTGGSPPR